MAKTYEVGYWFSFDPEGEHAEMFEGMDKEAMMILMKSLAQQDIIRFMNNETLELQVREIKQ